MALFGSTMNHSAQVASFIASSDAGGALLLNNSTLQVVVDSSPTSPIHPGGGDDIPAINSLGQIAFYGFDPNSLTSGVFLNSGGVNQSKPHSSANVKVLDEREASLQDGGHNHVP